MAGNAVGRRRVLGYGAATGVLGVAGVVGAAARQGSVGWAPEDSGPTDTEAPFDVSPAAGVLGRLLPRVAEAVRLVPTASSDGVDRFWLDSGKRVVVQGTSTSALLAGVCWYLKHVAGVTVSSPGDSLSQLPEQLPQPEAQVVGAATVPHRFALNDTENGYAGAYRDWRDWERTIDLLALHGFNEVLVPAGQDEVYRRVFTEFGFFPGELSAWIPGPAHQPWWLLGNLQDFAVSADSGALGRRVEVVRNVVNRLRELGLTPVLPGYAGIVPDGFGVRNPGAAVIEQGTWATHRRPDWLDTRDPLYVRIAESFYRHQAELYGTTTAYKMDLFHEGGNTGGVPVGDAAAAVMTALQTARPGATWVMLGWQQNPRRQVLDTLRTCGSSVCAQGKVLIVDGCSDRFERFDREADWRGTSYAFGTITNFGGRSLIGANARTWTERFPKEIGDRNSAMAGIAWMPEATGHDPAAFELFAELGWRGDPIDLEAWFEQYAARRYGKQDPHTAAAWRELAATAYSLQPGEWSHAQDSLFCAWPDLSATSAAPEGPDMRYDAARFQAAVFELLQADPGLRTVDAYRYDIVDFTRQTLANHARVLLPRIKAAYTARDLTGYQRLTQRWLEGMQLMETLLATDKRFLLGTWLRDGGYDARSLITTWGDRGMAGKLHDYAARELSGLLSDVYIPRWRTHFAALERVITGVDAELAPTDWFAMDDAWAHSANTHPIAPTGDPFAAANAVKEYLQAL